MTSPNRTFQPSVGTGRSNRSGSHESAGRGGWNRTFRLSVPTERPNLPTPFALLPPPYSLHPSPAAAFLSSLNAFTRGGGASA
jgi:hypothetical protein